MPHQDLGLLVIQRQQTGSGQNVVIGIAGQCRYQGIKAITSNFQNRAFWQVGVIFRQRPHQNARAGKGDRTLPAAFAHVPLHTQHVGDITGYFHNGRMDQHLRTRLVQLTHNVFQCANLCGVSHHYQSILALIRGHLDLASRGRLRRATRCTLLFHALAYGFQNLRQLLCIAVTQANDTRVFRLAPGGCIQCARQLAQALTHRLTAQNDQTICRGICNHLAARLSLFFAQGFFHHLGNVTGQAMTQIHDRMTVA